MSTTADVTLCIPAWQAAGFIDRTLHCARDQDYPALRILVSIDYCEDGTEAICRRHAGEDPRITVIAQPERLGWADNCNLLLDRVDTEFFSLYFHDDILRPGFVGVLRQALLGRPDAVAAYCDVSQFGNAAGVLSGTSYEGPPVQRLLKVMGPQRGAPLRALTRRRLLDEGLRFPRLPGNGSWRWYPYLVSLAASGPLLHVPGVHYERWIRADGMTAGWTQQTTEALRQGMRGSIAQCLASFDRVVTDGRERELLLYSLYLFAMALTRQVEKTQGAATLLEPGELADAFDGLGPPARRETLPPDVQSWLLDGERNLQSLEQQLRAGRTPA